MTVRARVLERSGAPLADAELELPEPDGDLVRVRLTASGVCHSDLHQADGDWSGPLPLVLGHEGAGVVEAVGPAVRAVKPGDHVVLSWYAPCRVCAECAAGRAWLCRGTRALEHVLPDGRATFADAAGEPVHAVPRPRDVRGGHARARGGRGADRPRGAAGRRGADRLRRHHRRRRRAQHGEVRAGESAVVVGCGGVGQAIVLGLVLAGADPIVAVDLSQERLDHARELGATHGLRGDDPELARHMRRATGGGADHAFDAIGRPETLERLASLTRWGGQGVIVGMPAEGTRVAIDPLALASRGKTLVGCHYGSSVPAVDFPKLAKLYLSGRLPLDRLVGRRADLDGADQALADLRAAVGLRTVLELA